MDQVLKGLDFAYAYIDDILVTSSDMDDHQQNLKAVFQRLRDYGLIINPSKCDFCVTNLSFLGHTVDSNGISPLDSKVKATMKALSVPRADQFLPLFPQKCCSNFTPSEHTPLHAQEAHFKGACLDY